MNRPLVDRIADAVLYEGYILYPYRPSLKNCRRWTFGGLFPEAYRRPAGDSDRSSFQAECLVRGGPGTVVDVRLRFLHPVARQVGAIDPPLARWPDEAGESEPPWRPVEALRVGERRFQTWQEAEECDLRFDGLEIEALANGAWERTFGAPGGRAIEPIAGHAGEIAGVLVRERQPVAGHVAVSAAEIRPGSFRLTVCVSCRSPLDDGAGREEALLRALASTHAILTVHRGAFVSLLDPPEGWREAAASCRNLGVWPVLAGEPGEAGTVLVSPIILDDYPRIAPESPGDLFDGLEIDEILSLRILTLTDEEKAEMAAVDPRASALLARTEALAREQLMSLHGTVRGLDPHPAGD